MVSDDNCCLRTEKVTYMPNGKGVLEEITIEIQPSGITLITGPSGSGKSTLLRLMGMLTNPTSGKITYKGKALDDFDPSEYRSRVIMIGQKPFLAEGTVRDNLYLPFTLKVHEDREATDELFLKSLRKLGLNEKFLDKKSSEISGGEAQRMALVRVIALQPEMLLLDEPSSALDMSAEENLLNLLAEIKDTIKIVVVAHSAAYLEYIDQSIILREGRVAGCPDMFTAADLKKCLGENL